MAQEIKVIGRPEFQPTDEQRDRVEWYSFGGLSEDEIAEAIGCSRPTLKKHFFDSLDKGRGRKKARVIDLLVASAGAGNVSAQKYLDQKGAAVGALDEFDVPKRPARLGKKEEAVITASNAGLGSEWGEDLRPPPAKLN